MTELLYVLIPIGFVVIVGVLSSLHRVKPVPIDEGIRSFEGLRKALDRRQGAESSAGTRKPRS
jgi:hypothetical protein